jgi:hypothetical protein
MMRHSVMRERFKARVAARYHRDLPGAPASAKTLTAKKIRAALPRRGPGRQAGPLGDRLGCGVSSKSVASDSQSDVDVCNLRLHIAKATA